MKLEDIESASNETLLKRKDEVYDNIKESFGVPTNLLSELCEVEHALTLRENR